MLFNSFQFLIFFPLVTALYFLLPARWRWALLLAASCVFYMAFVPAYILILAFTILVDYAAGLWIGRAEGPRRKGLLVASLVANLGVLAFFKYFNFLNGNLEALAGFLHWNYPIEALAIILPIGLSFHVFQSMSYTIEVYRGNQVPERHLGYYALYVMFYPQLVAGPIERPQNLLHQFRQDHRFDERRVTDGLKLMFWGFFLKVLVADRLAQFVNPVFANPEAYTGLPLILATLGFTFQIFGDFAGYSSIAIGAAWVMGIRLMRNFDRPYHSASIKEFWSRWHISLSTWFRDYLYIPLGGNRVPKWRWSLNLLIVFMVSGLWHGANWTFVIWGAIHGFYLVFAIWTASVREQLAGAMGLNRLPALKRGLAVAGTFGLVAFAWIFFRAQSLPDALYIATHLHVGLSEQLSSPQAALAALLRSGASVPGLVLALAGVAAMETVHLLQARGVGLREALLQRPIWLRWAAYQMAILAVLLFGVYENQAFIYFQF